MIITSDIRVTYRGNGQTTEFPFAFPFYDADYICVKIKDELTGLVTKLDADYFVDTNTNTVIYPGYQPGEEPPQSQQPPILPETSTITIYRNTEISQLIDLGSKYPLPIIEQALDKITEILQELKDNVDRSVKVDETSTETPDMYLQEIRTSTAQAVESKIAAAASEAVALASKQAAAISESNAATSATNASNSASAALASQQAAATSAGNAATSATNASNSASAALASQQAAASSKTAAEAAEGRIADRWGLRKKSTTYELKDIAYHTDLPTGYYLEVITPGITDSADLVLPSPIAENATVTDGTVTWKIRSISAEATTTDKGLLSPSDKSKIDNIPASGGAGFNHREIITTSGAWTAPTSGYYKVTCIGGGGAGGSRNTRGGQGGGTTSFGSYLSAIGGGGGGGATGFSGGGGGGAGKVSVAYISLTANANVVCTVGAGGVISTVANTDPTGEDAGRNSTGNYVAALAAKGAGNGINGMAPSGGYFSGCGGAGASNGTGYGGGGGGAAGLTQQGVGVEGRGADNGYDAQVYNVGGDGGNGGDGAIIIEYFLNA